ncbi:MAG: hypothetical protein J7L71_09330, partial [Spirochaetaceae bacterium]|nr:hypothetical protein [Spirochaetaceae bacterium]
MIPIIPIVLASIFSLALNSLVIFLLLKLAHQFKWYDIVDSRKIHKGEIPRIGGIGIAISFFLPVLITYFVYYFFPLNFTYSKNILLFWSLFTGAVIINMVGIFDDFKNIRPWYKLIGQISAALVIIFSGHFFTSFYILFLNIKIESIFI